MRNRPIPGPGGSGPVSPTAAGVAPTMAGLAPTMAGIVRRRELGRADAGARFAAGASGTPRRPRHHRPAVGSRAERRGGWRSAPLPVKTHPPYAAYRKVALCCAVPARPRASLAYVHGQEAASLLRLPGNRPAPARDKQDFP
jgi:hypothetical protein